MEVVNRTNLSETKFAQLLETIPNYGSMADLITWCLGQNPPLRVGSLQTIDEYTYDVIIPLETGLFLVYRTTWSGCIKAVAVWDHQPNSAELREARLDEDAQPRMPIPGYKPCRSAA